jgi:hypothetical protein
MTSSGHQIRDCAKACQKSALGNKLTAMGGECHVVQPGGMHTIIINIITRHAQLEATVLQRDQTCKVT